jgi:hypothetical protein
VHNDCSQPCDTNSRAPRKYRQLLLYTSDYYKDMQPCHLLSRILVHHSVQLVKGAHLQQTTVSYIRPQKGKPRQRQVTKAIIQVRAPLSSHMSIVIEKDKVVKAVIVCPVPTVIGKGTCSNIGVTESLGGSIPNKTTQARQVENKQPSQRQHKHNRCQK